MLRIFSPAFADGGPIPRAHTCDGANLSPPLVWSGAPDHSASLALIMDDPDAPSGESVHWVLYNVPPTATRLPSGLSADPELARPVQGRQGSNDYGRIGYGGPCPPPGSAHRYQFTLYALDTVLPLPPGSTKFVLIAAMRDHVLEETGFIGSYARA